MLMLFILLFFTLTGITLNNRQWLPTPQASQEMELALASEFDGMAFKTTNLEAQGQAVWQWLKQHEGLLGGELSVQWFADESLLLLDVKRPGGYTSVEAFPKEQRVWYENQSLGWMAVVNDLHMGRYSGKAWNWFIDVSAVVILFFTLTGFWLVLFHPKRRSRTLMLSGFGTLLMLVLYFWMLS